MALLLSACTVNMKNMDTRKAPKEMDLAQVEYYVKSGHGRFSSEFSAVLSVGKDSVIYQTYLTDKSMWFFVDKK